MTLMNRSVKAIVAAGVLATASLGLSAQAFADVDAGNSGTGNGGLVLAAWDGTHSVLEYLNTNFNTFDGGTSTSFSVNLSTLDTSNTTFMVFSPKDIGTGNIGKGLFATMVDSQPYLDATNNNPTGQLAASNIKVAADGASQVIANRINGSCAGATVCTGDASLSQPQYFEDITLGSNIDFSGSISSPLQFFKFLNSTVNTTSTSYAQIGSFSLVANGATSALNYTTSAVSAVPLPAALWLMLSGLAGMGVIGRRKNAVAA